MGLNTSNITSSLGIPYQQYVTSSAGHSLISNSTYFNDTSDNIPRYKDASGNIYDAIISSSYALTASHALNASTPTLDAVTSAGNVTSNNITAGTISGSSFKLNNTNALSFSGNVLYVGNSNDWTTVELGRETTDEIDINGNLHAENNLTASGDILIEGGGLDIKNGGAQSYARFYCESSNAHYTELKAQPHALYSDNRVTLLPAYDFDFAKPLFDASITASGAISASGNLLGKNLIASGSLQLEGGTFTSASLASAVAGQGETYDLNVSTDGDNVDLNLTSTSGTDNSVVQLTAGENITLTRNSSAEVTITAAGGGDSGGSGVFSQVGSTTQFSTTSSLLASGSNSAASASLEVHGSGSNIFKVEGSIGTLFSVDDGLDDVIFAANNISGTPVISANADNTVKLGKLGGFGIVISGSTPAPNDSQAKIIITGSIHTSGSLGVGMAASSTVGRIDAKNDVVAFSTSDERLKNNITPIENALDKVLQVQGIKFDWIEKEEVHGNKGHDVGVIAQEIEKVLPEVVQNRDNGYKAVKYEKIIPLLVEAIKELQAEVQELKKYK